VQEEWPSGGNGVTTAHSKSGGNSVALQLLRRLQSTTVLCSGKRRSTIKHQEQHQASTAEASTTAHHYSKNW